MTDETDFLDLYRKLRIRPDCSLTEFKQAYRRRVSLLHPDHRSGGHFDAWAAERLQRLTSQYAMAMEFQRRHGRLPGAPVPPRSIAADITARISSQPAAAPDGTRGPHSMRLVLLAVAALGVLLWSVIQLPSSEETASTQAPASLDPGQPQPTAAPAMSTMLSLGMSSESVRAIEGDPFATYDDRWEYGPSWISFQHDKIVDWYSSPLHPLKTAQSRPPKVRR